MLVGVVQSLLQGLCRGRLLLQQLRVEGPLQLQPLVCQGLIQAVCCF